MDNIAIALALAAKSAGVKAAKEAAKKTSSVIPGNDVLNPGYIHRGYTFFRAKSQMLSMTSAQFKVILTDGLDTAEAAEGAYWALAGDLADAICRTGEARLVVLSEGIPGTMPQGVWPIKCLVPMFARSLSDAAFDGFVEGRFVIDASSLGLGIIDKTITAKFSLSTDGGDIVIDDTTAGDSKYHCILPITVNLT